MTEIILSTNSMEFIMGMTTGVISGVCLGYFIYLNKGDAVDEN